ncbi:MAG: DNA-binding domain-containing protein [Rhodocyclaceae bacterium]|nr:DNA-binding domain-containing protein [Rhodocyclaceae bacterium]
MSLLPEQQTAFGAALVQGVSSGLSRYFQDAPDKLERRFAAYRRNFWSNHRSAMTATYRVVQQLVGAAVFRDLANGYIAGHPSHDADLNMYGGDFGDFLASHPLAAVHGYLPDMARLEWALLVAYGAPDAEPFDFAALAAVPPQRQAAIRITLHPGLALIETDYPLADIWHAHQIGETAARAVARAGLDQTPVRRRVLVARNAGSTVAPHAVSAGEGAFCRACLDGCTLEYALAAGLAAEPGLMVGALLPAWVGQGLIAGFRS